MKKTTTSMPIHSPAFPDPFVPYESPDYVSLYAIVEIDEHEVKRILAPTEFDYVNNYAVISITDFSNCNKIPYMDCAIVIPVQFEGKYGGYYIYEYENNDAAIAAGRELWGYPKKYADITLNKNNGIYTGYAKKNDKVFLEIEGAKTSNNTTQLEEFTVTPHLNIRTILDPSGGKPIRQIIERDTSPDFVLKEEISLDIKLNIQSTQFEPLKRLNPKVLGGGVIKGDFYATEENGWGEIISES